MSRKNKDKRKKVIERKDIPTSGVIDLGDGRVLEFNMNTPGLVIESVTIEAVDEDKPKH